MRVGPLLLLALMLAVQPAAAHGPVPVQPAAVWGAWSFDPLVIVPLLLAHWAYGRGVRRLWERAGRWRGIGGRHIAAFVLGEIAAIIALVSPVDQLGGTLLSAHMVQHGLLVAIAPPLLLLGLPGVAFAWALPPGLRKGFTGSRSWRWLAAFANALSRPLPASILHGLALWIWHAPAAFDAALEYEWMHTLEHASFFGTALLFWRGILGARSAREIGPALGAAFFILMHSGLLAALITLAPRPLYDWYGATELWGMTAIEDQQLAGLLMWVPMGLVYFGACLLLAKRLLAPDFADGPAVIFATDRFAASFPPARRLNRMLPSTARFSAD